jgi:hypothetical protein
MANYISPTFRAGAIVEVSGHYRFSMQAVTAQYVMCVAGEIFPEVQT